MVIAIDAVTQSVPSSRRRWTVLAICASAMFLVGLDTTIVNVALPQIGKGLDADTRGLEWVVNAYTVTLASLLITSGALADRIGRRRIFLTGLILFGAATLACAVAPTLGTLIAARVVQGAGASMLSPVALAIVVNTMPDPAERAKAIGVWASVFGLSMAVGPVTGGMLIAVAGWRAVFWGTVPLVLVAIVAVRMYVPESRGQRARQVDVPGQVLLAMFLGAAIWVLVQGPVIGWGSLPAVAGYIVTVSAFAGFISVELRRAEPLMDLGLFRRPNFTGAVVGAVAVFVALNVTLLLSTLYFQQVRGWAPLNAGAIVLPLATGAALCAPLSGMLVSRIGPRIPLAIAGVFTLLGGVCMTALGNDTTYVTVLAAYVLIGIGFGFANAPITNTAISGLPADRAGVAAGTTSTARQLGSAVGIAIAGGLAAGASPFDLADVIRPGWLVVGLCGLLLLLVAYSSTRRQHPIDFASHSARADTDRSAGR